MRDDGLLPQPALSRVAEVARGGAVSLERFAAEWVQTSRPVVLRGLVSDWPARRWDLGRLGEHWPKRAVVLRGSPDGLVETRIELLPEQISLRLLDDNRLPESEPDWFFDVRAAFPELLPELPRPDILRGHPGCAIYMGRDTATGAHYHPEHAMICQVHGEKRVILHAPDDSPRLCPHPLTRPQFRLSRIDLRAPDHRRFPRLRATRPFEARLAPGDALFIPVHWWHGVYGVGNTLSVTWLWPARLREKRFPHPGLRDLVGAAIWRTWPKLRGAARSARRLWPGPLLSV